MLKILTILLLFTALGFSSEYKLFTLNEETSSITTLSQEKLDYLSEGDILVFQTTKDSDIYNFRIRTVVERETSKSLFLISNDGLHGGSGTLHVREDSLSGTLYTKKHSYTFSTSNTKGFIKELKEDSTCEVEVKDSHVAFIPSNSLSQAPRRGSSVEPSIMEYDIMFVVTKQRFELYHDANTTKLQNDMQTLIDEINLRYINSNIPTRANLIHYHIGDGTMVQKLDDENKPTRDPSWMNFEDVNNIEAIRHEKKADVIMLFTADGQGGNARLNNCNKPVTSGECRWWKGNNYGRVGALYGSTTAHEIGHTMGLVHSFVQKEEGREFVWGRGHGVHNEFATTMAYQDYYRDSDRWVPWLPYFSNPDLDECIGVSGATYNCGSDHDREDSADASSAMTAILPYFTTSYDLAGDMAIADLSDSPLKECALQMQETKESESSYGFNLVYTSQSTGFTCSDKDFSNQDLTIEHYPYIESISLKNLQALNISFAGIGNLDRVSSVGVSDSNISQTLRLSSKWIEKLYFRSNNIENLDISGIEKLREIRAWSGGLKGLIDLSNNPDLSYVGLSKNGAISIDISGSNNIREFYMHRSSYSGVLDLSNLDKLQSINIEYSYQITSLKLSPLAHIKHLDLSHTNISKEDIFEFRNIDNLVLRSSMELDCVEVNRLRARGVVVSGSTCSIMAPIINYLLF